MTPTERRELLRKILQQPEKTQTTDNPRPPILGSVGKATLGENSAKIVNRCHDVRQTPTVGMMIVELCNLKIGGVCAKVSLDGVLPSDVCQFVDGEAFFAALNFSDDRLVFDNVQPFAKRIRQKEQDLRASSSSPQLYGDYGTFTVNLLPNNWYGNFTYKREHFLQGNLNESTQYHVQKVNEHAERNEQSETIQETIIASNGGEVVSSPLGGEITVIADHRMSHDFGGLGYYDYGVFQTQDEVQQYLAQQIKIIEQHPIFIANTNDRRANYFKNMKKQNQEIFFKFFEQPNTIRYGIYQVSPKNGVKNDNGFFNLKANIASFSHITVGGKQYTVIANSSLVSQIRTDWLAENFPIYFKDIPNRTYYAKRIQAGDDFKKYADETFARQYVWKWSFLKFDGGVGDYANGWQQNYGVNLPVGTAKYNGNWEEADVVAAPKTAELKFKSRPTFHFQCFQVAAKRLKNCEYAVANPKTNTFKPACTDKVAQVWSKMTALLGGGLSSFTIQDDDGNNVTLTATDVGWEIQTVRYWALIGKEKYTVIDVKTTP